MADDPTRPQPDDDPVARIIRERAEQAERERPHVAAVYAELVDELGRPPRLAELSEALRDRRGVERTPRALSHDLDVLRLVKYGRGRPPKSELKPRPDLDRLSLSALLSLARRAVARDDQATLRAVMERVHEHAQGVRP